jgi:hypothetical protein
VKQSIFPAFALIMVAGCNNTSPTNEAEPSDGDTSAVTQQEETAKQKLTIEQAAEEATKLIEADAKAEIDAAAPVAAEPAQ